MLHFSLL